MAAVDVRMRDSAENGEVVSMFAQDVQVRREFIVFPRLFRKESRIEQSQIVADRKHPSRNFFARRFVSLHRIEHRQAEHDPGAPKEMAPRHRTPQSDKWKVRHEGLAICS